MTGQPLSETDQKEWNLELRFTGFPGCDWATDQQITYAHKNRYIQKIALMGVVSC